MFLSCEAQQLKAVFHCAEKLEKIATSLEEGENDLEAARLSHKKHVDLWTAQVRSVLCLIQTLLSCTAHHSLLLLTYCEAVSHQSLAHCRHHCFCRTYPAAHICHLVAHGVSTDMHDIAVWINQCLQVLRALRHTQNSTTPMVGSSATPLHTLSPTPPKWTPADLEPANTYRYSSI